MKKIFMASLVAMMAVTTANAQIASTEYTDATFVAKEGFDDLVAATPQVAGNKADIKVIKEGAVVQVGINQAAIEAINKSAVMTSGVKADTVTQVATNKTDIANINKSDAMTSGVNKAVVGMVTTNADNIGAIAQSDYIKSLAEGNRTLTGAVNSLASTKADKSTTYTKTEAEAAFMDAGEVAAAITSATSADSAQVATNKTDIAALQVGKVDKNQTVANANKAMVTDGKGDVVPGSISAGMIDGNAVTLEHLNTEVKAVLGDGVNAMEAIEGMNSETTGAGPIVKSVTQTEGKVTVGLGYIETADINKVAVTTEKIADGAVTTGKIQDRAVGGAKIADSGVVTRNIADDAIVTSKILDASVTKAKLDASVKATLDKADNAMQETGLKALDSWADQKCGDTNVTCSLVSKSGVIAWEAVKY